MFDHFDMAFLGVSPILKRILIWFASTKQLLHYLQVALLVYINKNFTPFSEENLMINFIIN